MSLKVSINGFGRIGKLVLQAIRQRKLLGNIIDVVAIVDKTVDTDYFYYRMNYDSVHKFMLPKLISQQNNDINCVTVDNHNIQYIEAREHPSLLPWKELCVDCVVDATGVFTKTTQLREHLIAGADKVIVTAPYKNDDDVKDKITIIVGVNEKEYDNQQYNIISCASCTSNCIIPIISILRQENIGIQHGMATSIHAYTSSQNVLDGVSSKNWRIGRCSNLNIIPTSTGFSNTISEVYPDMKDIISGISFRVPINDVSVVDFTFTSKKTISILEIDQIIKAASKSTLNGILDYTEEELVSSDFIGNSCSTIYDSILTMNNNVSGNNKFFKVIAWYDNEWGYANRVVDMLELLSKEY